MAVQIPVTGPVVYEKVIYETYNKNRQIDIHYLGDEHNKKTKCADPHAISLLTTTLAQGRDTDVFIEVGLGYVGKARTNYLNELTFQTNQGLSEKQKCSEQYPNVRFHCVDFRHTLFLEYMTVLEPIIEPYVKMKRVNEIEYGFLDSAIQSFANRIKDGKNLPYVPFDELRELQRLLWISSMLMYRQKRYRDVPPLPFSTTLGDFIGDLYYLMINEISYDTMPLAKLLPEPIQKSYKPYYHYRLSHEYRSIPEIIKSQDLQVLYECEIVKKLQEIKASITPTDFEREMIVSPQLALNRSVINSAWLMDMYVCFRSMKPYVTHIIIVLGVNHIIQMKQFMKNIRVVVKESVRFDNPNVKGELTQCISIPTDHQRLLLDTNEMFQGMVVEKPVVRVLGKKTHEKEKKVYQEEMYTKENKSNVIEQKVKLI